MPFDWRDFFLLAHALRKASGENEQRTSVGRSYYYAYNAALIELAKNQGYNPNAPAPVAPGRKPLGVHQKLWD